MYGPPGSVCGSIPTYAWSTGEVPAVYVHAVHTTVSLPTVADRILRVFASAVFVARKCFLCIFKSTDLVVHFCLHYYECSRLFSQGSIYVIL